MSRDLTGTEILRTPPYSVEAEQAVLGGIMLHSQAFDEVADMLRTTDFFRADHQVIWDAIRTLDEQQKPFDYVSLAVHLDEAGKLERIGGISYLGTMASNTPTTANIRRYAQIVADRSRERRALIALGEADDAIRGPGETDAKLAHAQELLGAAAEKHGSVGPRQVKETLKVWVDALDERFTRGGDLVGLPTGFTDLDTITNGLSPADLIIVAGRPSMGKTTFAMNIAEHVAVEQKKPVAVFSMEMPSEQLNTRLMASLTKVSMKKLQKGNLDDDDWPRLTAGVALLADAPLFIDDAPALSPTDIRARARRIHRKHGLGLIVIDYLQLSQIPGFDGNRVGEVSEVSRQFKALAKELNVPVVALSQLNRGLENRPDKRPRMSDLRESGAIEQDADLIVFMYRDEVYDSNSADKGTAEAIIAKHRNGELGMVRLVSRLDVSRFENSAFRAAALEQPAKGKWRGRSFDDE